MRITNKKSVMTYILFVLVASVILIATTACGGGSSSKTTAPPTERTYDIQDPNVEYEGKSTAERHEYLFSKLSELSNGEVVPFELPSDYVIVESFIEYDQNIHTRKEMAKVTKVSYTLGKVGSNYTLAEDIDALIKYYNSNNRFLWTYGPFETLDEGDDVSLSLLFNNPIMNRHLEPNSYSYPVEVRRVGDDKPVLVFTQLITGNNQQRSNYQVYEWQAVGEHRYRLTIKQGSSAESSFDVVSFIESTFK